jgi:hypothetical protein
MHSWQRVYLLSSITVVNSMLVVGVVVFFFFLARLHSCFIREWYNFAGDYPSESWRRRAGAPQSQRWRLRPSAHGKIVLQRESQIGLAGDCCAIGSQSIHICSPHTSRSNFGQCTLVVCELMFRKPVTRHAFPVGHFLGYLGRLQVRLGPTARATDLGFSSQNGVTACGWPNVIPSIWTRARAPHSEQLG